MRLVEGMMGQLAKENQEINRMTKRIMTKRLNLEVLGLET